MKRETQNILLILLGGALLKIAINGDYLRYVKPSQQPWIIAGGVVMLVLGVVAILRDLRGTRKSDVDDGHGHQHRVRSAWLLMVPVLAVFLVAPPALGADSVTRTGARAPQSAVAADAAAFPPLPPGDVVPLAVNEFVSRAGWDRNGTLNGRTVSLSGFVVHTDGQTLLARMVISCCAADAFPVTVRLTGGSADRFASDAWVEVTGQVVPGSATKGNSYTPDLAPVTLRGVGAPKDPYEY
ncbi:TIGR03943 family putative permease subunit [Amycolatopsis sp. H20-H5]|uniref:TIGR03943 family putative permease subunit n=1 Tax=Amycolatopsis sp. H20-H5 TaxID=3046309 RepID=UPI002DB6225C|nr:TIGR03943 family protein [Amycolatopsis sp. H20-H5]MEC3977202.1 TIGR03943 family protein [Amycolatopsis sp. H20-H5]